MSKHIELCTTDEVPGKKIVGYRGMVWASSTRSKNIFSDVGSVLRSLAGGEIRAYKRMGNEARAHVLAELAESAQRMGADAVVGVRFGSTQLLPSTMEVVAYGTAVTLAKK